MLSVMGSRVAIPLRNPSLLDIEAIYIFDVRPKSEMESFNDGERDVSLAPVGGPHHGINTSDTITGLRSFAGYMKPRLPYRMIYVKISSEFSELKYVEDSKQVHTSLRGLEFLNSAYLLDFNLLTLSLTSASYWAPLFLSLLLLLCSRLELAGYLEPRRDAVSSGLTMDAYLYGATYRCAMFTQHYAPQTAMDDIIVYEWAVPLGSRRIYFIDP
ncbi:hypothetical protein L227DRAFT_182656 [Lentinus tigrinus ALCF2SS1-6]|uniref:Uncharacterized protein n=1 Tax=Lentinus tigrinus ALCF2SS1-6 TaxID=1328759 RepID=A0A5C2S4T2_9APHY|nr:hypothetical protein L227DRAFT_182656 [Lentinus tigrinus ALCF2SS1-6]